MSTAAHVRGALAQPRALAGLLAVPQNGLTLSYTMLLLQLQAAADDRDAVASTPPLGFNSYDSCAAHPETAACV